MRPVISVFELRPQAGNKKGRLLRSPCFQAAVCSAVAGCCMQKRVCYRRFLAERGFRKVAKRCCQSTDHFIMLRSGTRGFAAKFEGAV